MKKEKHKYQIIFRVIKLQSGAKNIGKIAQVKKKL